LQSNFHKTQDPLQAEFPTKWPGGDLKWFQPRPEELVVQNFQHLSLSVGTIAER